MESADCPRARTLSQGFQKTVEAVFSKYGIQDVQECFPRIVDAEYHEELLGLLTKVLESYREFAKEEFEEICTSAQVAQGLSKLEQLCTAQGVQGSGSAATVTWNPSNGPSPLAVAREQRMQAKLAEKARLVQQLEQVHLETQATAQDLQEKRRVAAEMLATLEGATSHLNHVQAANSNFSDQVMADTRTL